jgi:hypothetical protein
MNHKNLAICFQEGLGSKRDQDNRLMTKDLAEKQPSDLHSKIVENQDEKPPGERNSRIQDPKV